MLLHGAAATRKSFALQIEALKVCSHLVRLATAVAGSFWFIFFWSSCTQSDYRLVVPDLPGHGSRDNQQFTMQTGTRRSEPVGRAVGV